MNLRVAILEKNSFLNKKMFDDVENKNVISKWVVMGHFDMLSICELQGEQNFFETIYKNNRTLLCSNDTSSYRYPIYLMTNENDLEFWSNHLPFFSIIKIHFSSSVDHEKNYECLKQDLNKEAKSRGFEYHIYNTFELSDIVVVIKSNKLSTILSCTKKLRSYFYIGKIYTYPAISVEALKGDGSEFKEEDIIEYISLRFSVFSSAQINKIVNMVKNILNTSQVYSITGVDDILFNRVNATAKDLFNFYSNIFIKPEKKFEDLSSLITRVGVTILNDDFCGEEICEHTSINLSKACKKMLLKLETIAKNIDYKKHKWFDSLFELIKLLNRMSQTPVLDEFVYLLLPGMIAFIDNIYLIYLDTELLDENSQEYNIFVQGIIDLIEQIMRSEVQLVHSPELRPIMYNLPIVVVEYTQALLRQCSELLKKADNSVENIRLLLVPKIIDRIETVEVFSATSNLDGLIEISIPLDMLYNPLQLQCNLCHEVSHFIGEHHRNRKLRVENYSRAVAVLMEKTLFGDFSHDMIKPLEMQVKNLLNSGDCNYEDQMMQSMQTSIERWIEGWFGNPQNYYNFINNTLSLLETQNSLKIHGNTDEIHYNYSNFFAPLLEETSKLFKEIYADICMLFLLPISPEEYIKLFASELIDKSPMCIDAASQEVYGSLLYEIHYIRIFAALKATKRSFPQASKSDPPYYVNICEAINKIDDYYDQENEISSFIPMGVIIQLCEYAKKCYDSLYDNLENDEDFIEMKKNILGEGDLDFNQISTIIEDYRYNLLKALKDYQ